MNETELASYRARITARLDEITAENAAGKDSQQVVELDQQAVGRLSRQDALQMQAMAKAQQVRRDAETTRLQAALERIADGSYGFCEDCLDPIPPGRLALDLAAQRCVNCITG